MIAWVHNKLGIQMYTFVVIVCVQVPPFQFQRYGYNYHVKLEPMLEPIVCTYYKYSSVCMFELSGNYCVHVEIHCKGCTAF